MANEFEKWLIILIYSFEFVGPVMTHTIAGVNIAKSVMQVHWVDPETGEVVNRGFVAVRLAKES
ncbi:hypothetical protein [Paraburkholderia kirstenboschensis]|uniref:Uncharacterized protein n=1 Tax=Paraburkholderia kirstenboschensis TaxID=1245436 RepID=A0ABZ0EEH2_9BURK|nr:hypothetical protein [Paraburkholderia kirstenboschensis]WOD14587.1 hypothetical protein RW095_03940 [Paraburkholderia kirstenboschensis]